MQSNDSPTSQTSTAAPITLNPIPATAIAYNEISRRSDNLSLGLCKTECSELDDYVLQGGLERGSVVGVSAEKEDFSVTLSMQLLAQGLKTGTLTKILIITPKPKVEILRPLRSALNACSCHLQSALERVELSQVFDIDGVWEVLADLDREPSLSPHEIKSPTPELARPEASLEIGDSQDSDEEAFSPAKEATPAKDFHAPIQEVEGKESKTKKQGPDLIIITHFSSLLTSLFTARPSSTAHPLLQALSSHIRHLSRTLPCSPLILLLNSTASPSDSSSSTSNPNSNRNNPLDPTLRSIFNPPVIPGLPSTGARRNKPSFGMVFSQILDVHLLCTRLPRTGRDADEIFAGGGAGGDEKFVTIVEVLLDELGVWEGDKGGKRNFREQRWGAVDVKEGRVADAFDKGGAGNFGEVRLAAGFGGPRV